MLFSTEVTFFFLIFFFILSSHFKVSFESKWCHGSTSWRMAQTKCTGIRATDCRAALINKWLALPGTKRWGIDPTKKWSQSVSNIVLIKVVYTCFEKVLSRGLSGSKEVVGALFLCLLLLPFFLCWAFFSLGAEGELAGSSSAAAATDAITALAPVRHGL